MARLPLALRFPSGNGDNVRPQTVSGRVYEAIRTAIRDGDLVVGESYSEQRIADLLHVSRTPAREALQRLESEGLIDVAPQRGFKLRHITSEERVEFFVLRNMLEGYVVKTLCKQATPSKLGPLRDILDEQREATGDLGHFMALDEQFHLMMADIAGLRRTARFISGLRGVLWLLGTEAVYRRGRRDEVIGEHNAIYEAIAAGNAQVALQQLTRHLASTAAALGVDVDDLVSIGPDARRPGTND